MKENYTVSFTKNDIAQARLVKAENAEQALAYFAEIEPTATVHGASLDQCNLESRGCPVEVVPDGWQPTAAQEQAEQQTATPTTAEARKAYAAYLDNYEAAKADKNNASEALRQVTRIERGTEDTMRKAANIAATATAAADRAAAALAIAAENVRAAWIAEHLPKICEVLNRYEGKKVGEKTKEKISDELYTATGCRVRVVFPEYGSDYLSVYGEDIFPRGLEIYRQYSPEGGNDFRDKDSKLKHFSPDLLCGCSFDYIADPAAKLAELEKKLEAVKAARAALTAAIDEYNAASGSAFENLNEREISHRCDIIARR